MTAASQGAARCRLAKAACIPLTRWKLPAQVLAGKGLKLILDLPSACFMSNLEPHMSAIFRHILEDPGTLQTFMEAEISTTMTSRARHLQSARVPGEEGVPGGFLKHMQCRRRWVAPALSWSIGDKRACSTYHCKAGPCWSGTEAGTFCSLSWLLARVPLHLVYSFRLYRARATLGVSLQALWLQDPPAYLCTTS